MDWKTLQGYEEKYAKITVKPHKTFDGKVIEVLYGALDENGQPTLAIEGHEDGHGRWYGIESNGEYMMLVWQKPVSQGGDIEYGTEFRENAVEELEKDVRHKQELCRRVEMFHAGTSAEEIEAVKKEWEAIQNWKTAKEVEYKAWFDESLEKLEILRIEKVQKTKHLFYVGAQKISWNLFWIKLTALSSHMKLKTPLKPLLLEKVQISSSYTSSPIPKQYQIECNGRILYYVQNPQ